MAWRDLRVLGAPSEQEVPIVSPAGANKKGDVGEGNPGTQDLRYHFLGKVGSWAWGPSVARSLWKEGRLCAGLVFDFDSYQPFRPPHP